MQVKLSDVVKGTLIHSKRDVLNKITIRLADVANVLSLVVHVVGISLVKDIAVVKVRNVVGVFFSIRRRNGAVFLFMLDSPLAERA